MFLYKPLIATLSYLCSAVHYLNSQYKVFLKSIVLVRLNLYQSHVDFCIALHCSLLHRTAVHCSSAMQCSTAMQ